MAKPKWHDDPRVILPIALAAIIGFFVRYCVPEAHAQTPVVFKLLPPGHDGVVQGVGRARYYLLDEYLKLAQLDAEFVKMQADLGDTALINDGLKKELVAKDTVISTLESDKKILADRSLRLEENWKKCEDELIKCSSCIVPYIIGAVGAAVGLFGMGMWLGGR